MVLWCGTEQGRATSKLRPEDKSDSPAGHLLCVAWVSDFVDSVPFEVSGFSPVKTLSLIVTPEASVDVAGIGSAGTLMEVPLVTARAHHRATHPPLYTPTVREQCPTKARLTGLPCSVSLP